MEDKTQYATYPSLRGRPAVVTGGATGIGEAIVRALCGQGSRVAFLDIDRGAAALIANIHVNPPSFHPCD